MPVPPQNVWRPRPREKDAQQHKYSARVWDNNMNPLNLQQLSMLSFMRMPPKPRWMPLPGLLYAQVIKTTRRRRLVRVTHRVVFGTLEAVEQALAACGWHINTAFIERLNLSIRQHVAAI